MSNLSDFLPSGSGGGALAPVNAVTARYSTKKTITDEDGSVWLKGGSVITENLQNYPEANLSVMLPKTISGNQNSMYTAEVAIPRGANISNNGLYAYVYDYRKWVVTIALATPFSNIGASVLSQSPVISTSTYNIPNVNLDGTKGYLTYRTTSLKQFDLTTPYDFSTFTNEIDLDFKGYDILCFDWIQDGNAIIALVSDGTLIRFNCTTQNDLTDIVFVEQSTDTVNFWVNWRTSIRVSADGNYVSINGQNEAATDGAFKFYNLKNGAFDLSSVIFKSEATPLGSDTYVISPTFDKSIEFDGNTNFYYTLDSYNFVGVVGNTGKYDYVRIL